jgi:DNA-binding protein HU-beta
VNRSELVAAVAEKSDLSQKDVDAVLSAFADTVISEVSSSKDAKISLPGFLTIEVGFRNARTARNPQTGAEIQVAATHTAKVSAGSKLKAAAAKNN